MPVHRVTIDGVEGWRYGDTGKLYTGKDARRKAIAQAAAIHASQSKRASYMDIMEKLAALDAWEPMKLELPRGPKMPALKIPTWTDAMDPEKAQKEQAKKDQKKQKQETLANPGQMDVTIKFRR